MGVKKELQYIKTQLDGAKTEFGKHPPDLETIEQQLGRGSTALGRVLLAYKAKKTKTQIPLRKAKDSLKKLEGIIKDGDSIAIIDLLKKAFGAAAEAEKATKAD